MPTFSDAEKAAMQERARELAVIETIDNGKPIRETVNVDLPLCIDHFRYFASVIRAEESSGPCPS